jgi:hypothetical protein
VKPRPRQGRTSSEPCPRSCFGAMAGGHIDWGPVQHQAVVAGSHTLLACAKKLPEHGELLVADGCMSGQGSMRKVPPQLLIVMADVCRSAEQLEAEEQAQRDLERLRLIREKRCAPPRSCSRFCPASQNELAVPHDCLKWVPTRQQRVRC